MTSVPQHNPNPPCPACGSAEVFGIVHDVNAPPDFVSTQGWMRYDGVCDIRPDKWECTDCDFRWYARTDVERDLDMLTWQLSQLDADIPRDRLQERLTELRKKISTLARPVSQ